MLKQVWMQTQSANTWKPTVEMHEYRDGTIEYSFRNRLGRPYNVTEQEAKKIIAEYKMTDVTAEMRKEGWIK